MTSPSATNATADGTTKKASRARAASMRARSAANAFRRSAASPDIAGSSAAEIEMPKRLTGSV